MEDGRIVNEMVMQFCRKGFRDHLTGIATRWGTYSLTAISVFTVLFTGIQAPAYFLKIDFGDPRLYLGTIIGSLLVALFWTVREYLNDFPAGSENESRAARRIAQLQRARWEHRLTAHSGEFGRPFRLKAAT